MKSGTKTAYDAEGRRKYLSQSEGQKFVQHAANLPKAEAFFA